MQLILYLYIYFYGCASLPHEWKNVVAADATQYTEQACVSDMKQHQLLVQRECVGALRESIGTLVDATGGVDFWGKASSAQRVDFTGACFDLAPVRLCRVIFPKLGKSVDFPTVFFIELDDMMNWRSFTRFRFVYMCENIFIWEMMNPSDDVRLLLYSIWRALPSDDDIAELKEALGGMERVPSSPLVGRSGDKPETVSIGYPKPGAAKKYAPVPVARGGGGEASAVNPLAYIDSEDEESLSANRRGR